MPAFARCSDSTRPGISRNTIWALLLTTFLLAAGAAVTAPVTARASTPADAPSQHEKPPPTLWGACPVNGREDAEHKLVRKFQRGPGVSTTGEVMPGGESDLVCGHDGYGYYHIANGHGAHWTQKGVKSSENWRSVADYAIEETLKNPQRVTYRPANDAFCYSREIDLIDKVRGIVVDVFFARVAVSHRDGRIITAYPARQPC